MQFLRAIMAFFCAIMLCACGTRQSALYTMQVDDLAGQPVRLSDYRGKVLLVVNTATRCGFTPQYEALEQLYAACRDKGFEVLDFPCNQFGEQAPGSNEAIHTFCTQTYDIEFPQFGRIDVNGAGAAPLFTWLKAQKGFEGFDLQDRMGQLLDQMLRRQNPDYATSSDIKWNFTKFLIDRRGRVVGRFEPTVPMDQVGEVVRRLIEK